MSKSTNDNLYKFSTETPWQYILVVILYTIGAVGFPTSLFTWFLGDGKNAELIALFLARAICCILPIWLINEVKDKQILSFKNFFKRFWIIIPFLIVALNNFPFLPLINGDLSFTSEANLLRWGCYLLACLGGVLIEELTFRGLIFTALLKKYKNHKQCAFISVFLQSALFGVVHLVNLFAGAGIGSVVMQIGYSFLIGAMCAIAFLKTGNFYTAVLLHFIFNIGGLLFDGNMITGVLWTTANVILTAVVAVIVIVYAVYLVFVNKNNLLEEKLK